MIGGVATVKRASKQLSQEAGVAAHAQQGEAPDAAPDDVVDRICATLADAIAEGALKPGVKIMEDVLGDHFGVSRTVVRGALGMLQREHLLERKKNRGTFVAEPTIEEAKNLFEARRVLERLILTLAIERATPEDLASLEQITRDERRVHSGEDDAAKSRQSGQFHVVLAQMARNPVLTETLAKIVARLSLVMALYGQERHDECGADDHRSILAAIHKRDVERACSLMEQHLRHIETHVRLDEAPVDRNSFLGVIESFARMR
jgi:DNA-binding GntR family transcriptional regulator